MPQKILLIEDNEDHALLVRKTLEGAGEAYRLDVVSGAEEGLSRMLAEEYDAVLCDYRLPGSSALDVLREMKRKRKDLPFIVVTASGNELAAVALMKEGAYDYILKDVSYEDALPMVVKKSIDESRLKKENERVEGELRETQRLLIQSEKMAAMGQLAAGISHELNQPLTGIKGFAQILIEDFKEDGRAMDALNKIVEQAVRMDRIITNIRLFARKSEFEMTELDVHQPLEDSLMLIGEQLRVHGIRLVTDFDRGLPRIRGDRNQLQQAFLNLVTNARDGINSLPDAHGGTISFKTAAGGRKDILITVKDTGCGIQEKDLMNIFDPFFTTKSPGGGMGLGLSIVYRIIENHQGVIDVESRPGQGTLFKISLPVRAGDLRS